MERQWIGSLLMPTQLPLRHGQLSCSGHRPVALQTATPWIHPSRPGLAVASCMHAAGRSRCAHHTTPHTSSSSTVSLGRGAVGLRTFLGFSLSASGLFCCFVAGDLHANQKSNAMVLGRSFCAAGAGAFKACNVIAMCCEDWRAAPGAKHLCSKSDCWSMSTSSPSRRAGPGAGW